MIKKPNDKERHSKMKNLVKFCARPRLKSPNMLAAWPGIGNVSMIVATYLQRKLHFKELGEIEPPQFPQSKFYFWKNRGGGSDIILFIGEDQPTAKGYELANCVLDVALRLQSKRVYTCAAALSRIHHAEPPKVWGVATRQQVVEDLKRYDIVQRSNFQIAGLNGLLLGVAKERNIDAVCLLGEVPMYASRIQNPMAALAVVDVLTKILDISIDTTELAQIARETKEVMKQVAAEAMGEYIDYFTAPIWEHDEEEEEEEEE